MKKFINKMKQREDSEKRIFAFWTALMITMFIFGIWLLNLISVYGNLNTNQQNIRNEAGPISTLVSQIKSVFSENEELYLSE